MNKLESLLINTDFWAAVIAIVTAVLVSLNVPQGSVTQVTTIISATAAFIAFVIGKGAVQIAKLKLEMAQIEKEAAQIKAGIYHNGFK